MYLLVIFIIFIALALIGVMIYDGNRFVIDNYEFENSKVSETKRFVFLTDLHNKEYGYENESLIKAIEDINPDMILIGGDMIVAKPGKETYKIAQFVGKLKMIAPVVYALGNHEFRLGIYPEVYGDMYNRYKKELADVGINFLDNSFVEFDDFRIYGLTIEKEYYRRFISPKMADEYVESLVGPLDKNKVNILLAHNPDYFKAYAASGADLSLSGHLHGGIMRLPWIGGILSPKISFFPKYNGGKYSKFGSNIIVSKGLGVHTIPVRIFNPAEISVITFRTKKSV